MKVSRFTYTDTKQKVTQRQVVVVDEPSDKLCGIDVSELSPEQLGAFAKRMNTIQDTYLNAIAVLQKEFDVKHNYRQFIPARMQEVESEYL